MKKRVISVFMLAGMLSVLLSGCQTGGGAGETGAEYTTESDVKVEVESEHEDEKAEAPLPVPPYQFVKEYGIIKSEDPVYILDPDAALELTQGDVRVSDVFAIQHQQELIVGAILEDYAEVPSEEAMSGSYRYQDALWRAGEGLMLTGSGLPPEGCRPKDAMYVPYPAYYEAYGHMRYFIESKFELPVQPDDETAPSEYTIQILDLESPVTLPMKQAPGYDTLEALAAGEQGSVVTHGDYTIISIGELVDEGIHVFNYVSSENGQPVSITYGTQLQSERIDLPALSVGDQSYSIKTDYQLSPDIDRMGMYRLEEANADGRCRELLFEIPEEEQVGDISLTIPGLTFTSGEVSAPVTLAIPEDFETLAEEIPFEEGNVRLQKITNMKEPQKQEILDSNGKVTKVIERPAVYLDVSAASDTRDLALRALLCQRQNAATQNGWEHQRYDYDEKGNLSGFRIFYDEGDTEVTLRFDSPAFFWAQPFEMELNPSRAVPTFQFVKGQGIIKSKDPLYVLDTVEPAQLTEDDVTVTLLSAVQYDQDLYAEFRIEDRSERAREAAEETTAAYEPDLSGKQITFPGQGFYEKTWMSGDPLKLTGPNLPEHGSLPSGKGYSSEPHFLEHYGYVRYFMSARFRIPDLDLQEHPSGYVFDLTGFSTPMKFSMKPAPGYQTFGGLAAGQGGMDTHEGYSILVLAQEVEEGILTDLYTYHETDNRIAVSDDVRPASRNRHPVLSADEKTYPVQGSLLYQGMGGRHQILEQSPGTQHMQLLYDVPKKERDAALTLTIPGVILISKEASDHVTLEIPEDSKELAEVIPFEAGNLHIQKITRLSKPREYQDVDAQGNLVTTEKDALYIAVSLESHTEEKKFEVIGCRRKAEDAVWYTENEWEYQQADYDKDQNLKGFYVLFDEDDTEITLRFTEPWYYWKQPFMVPIQIKNQ